MNMQMMLQQAQKMQKDLKKAMNELSEKEFVVSKNGLVTVTVLGDKSLKSVDIDKDALEEDNKEMIEESIVLAFNEALEKIEEAVEEINLRITGRREGLGM